MMIVIPSGSQNSGYKLTRSLRFRRSASANLSRTATTSATWTLSTLVKRGALGVISPIFGDGLKFLSGDTLTAGSLTTTAVFRDPSSWYHIFVSNNGLYINGVLFGSVTTSALTNPKIGSNGTDYFDGLLAEVNFIDGQALTPSSFGEFDSQTGVWKPKKYTGTYGTNGFYLPFTDNSALTTSSNVGLGKDFSGNGNYWTTSNISITAGATYDSFTDVPTLTSSTASNFAVLNPLVRDANTGNYATVYLSYSNGNLRCVSPTTDSGATQAVSTIKMREGKSIAEFTLVSGNGSGKAFGVTSNVNNRFNGAAEDNTGLFSYTRSGTLTSGSTTVASGLSTFGAGDVVGVCYDGSAATVTFYKNGVLIGSITGLPFDSYCFSATLSSNYGGVSDVLDVNFGQRPWTYTPPTGFLPLNTFNLPDSTIKAGNKYFDATLYTGNGSTKSVTNAGAFLPDLVWVKSRSAATDHKLTDSVRGVTKGLISDTTGAETTDTNGVTAFNGNGFALGTDTNYNNNAATYVGWQWKKGATPGFDIVTYTGTLTADGEVRIAHSLGVAPVMIITKSRSGTSSWIVRHKSLANWNNILFLDTTTAQIDVTAISGSVTAPTSSTFPTSWLTGNNINGVTTVAYLWSEIPGFSKFGSYTGNGSIDGPFVYCGFRPRYLIYKNVTGAGTAWMMLDTSRSPHNISNLVLRPNLSDAEAVGPGFDLLSNGFKVRGSGASENTSGGTYIFAAFAENPFKHALAR